MYALDGFDFSNKMFIPKQKDDQLRKGKLHREDVVLTTRGTVGNTAYYDNSVIFDNIRINSGMLIFRTDRKELLPEFLFYYFQSEECKRQFRGYRFRVSSTATSNKKLDKC